MKSINYVLVAIIAIISAILAIMGPSAFSKRTLWAYCLLVLLVAVIFIINFVKWLIRIGREHKGK